MACLVRCFTVVSGVGEGFALGNAVTGPCVRDATWLVKAVRAAAAELEVGGSVALTRGERPAICRCTNGFIIGTTDYVCICACSHMGF